MLLCAQPKKAAADVEEVEEEAAPNLIGAREGEIVVSFAPPRRPDRADTKKTG